MPSVTVKDVDQQLLVVALAGFLERSGKIKMPECGGIIKTSTAKELAPADPCWFFVRTASTLRHMYCRAPVGVKSLRNIFGSRKRNGVRPSHYCRASAGIFRYMLQQLEAAKLVEKSCDGGRLLTQQGRRDLDRIAAQVKKAKSKTVPTNSVLKI